MPAGKCNASPQTEQYDPCRGCNANKQVSQTGRRETLISGEPQIRQSAGKSVKNKVAAARLAKPANTCSAAWPWAARIRNPVLLLLLLKTASLPGNPILFRRAALGQYKPRRMPYATRLSDVESPGR